MTTPRTASDIKATMKASVQQGMAVTEQAEGSDVLAALVGTPNLRPNKRFTVILTSDQHRFIKRFAVDHNSDASALTRTIFALLQSDKAFAELVLGHLPEEQ
jgi:hypothetical protein